jgi:hypothetical protein
VRRSKYKGLSPAAWRKWGRWILGEDKHDGSEPLNPNECLTTMFGEPWGTHNASGYDRGMYALFIAEYLETDGEPAETVG